MLADLQDSHTGVLAGGRAPMAWPGLQVREVEGKAVVTRVLAGSDAQAAGVRPGDVVTALDGIPVPQALARVPKWATAFAAARTRRRQAYGSLLAGPAGSTVRVTLETPAQAGEAAAGGG